MQNVDTHLYGLMQGVFKLVHKRANSAAGFHPKQAGAGATLDPAYLIN